MIYLASASPRRRELLTQIGVRFAVLAQHIDESAQARESPQAYVSRIAAAKAAAALRDPRRLLPIPVLSADTTVVLGDAILGKPHSLQEGSAMLERLSGNTHSVLTAVTVAQPERSQTIVVATEVGFRTISEAEMRAYWASGEPLDKAGGYGIQGRAAMFVQHLSGSYSNVVGLPLFETAQLLADFGIDSTRLLAGSTA